MIAATPLETEVYALGPSNRLVGVTAGGSTVVGLGYDVQGNLANKNGVLHSFDFGNRLRTVTDPVNSRVSTYAYDGQGRRVKDVVNGAAKHSQYLNNGQLVLASDANTVDEYVHLQGSLLAIRSRDVATSAYTTKYQHTDALGTPIAVTSQSRALLETSEYEPFGQQVNAVGAPKNGPGYAGHVQDGATGLTYMQQRYYDPMIGRFLSVDPVAARPVGDNFNRYWYANNNPYRFTDPDGRETFDCRGSKTCASEIKVADLKKGDVVKTDGATVRVGRKEVTVTFNKGYENGSSAARTGPNIVPAGPQGASLEGNAAQAKEMSPNEFRDQVKNKGPWDYKQQGGQYQPFGNFNCGLTGTAAGFPSAVFFQEAGIAQSAAGTSLPSWGTPGLRGRPWSGSGSFGDDPVDQFWIQQGIRQYEKVGSRRIGFVSLLLACLSACSYPSHFSCEKKLHDEIASSDGKLKAAILDVQCGATTQDASWVVVSNAHEEFDEERDKVAIFEGAVNRVEWHDNELHVVYGTSKPFLMNKEAKGAQVIYKDR